MNNPVEEQVAQYYSHGTLEETILEALKAAGKNPDKLELADLEPFDEFHAGGREATVEFGTQMDSARAPTCSTSGAAWVARLVILHKRSVGVWWVST